MKYRLLVASLAGTALAIAGCQDSGPVSPESLPAELGPSLTGAPGTPVTAIGDLSPGIPLNAAECLRVDNQGTTHFHKCEFPGTSTGDLETSAPGGIFWVATGKQDAGGNGTGGGRISWAGTWHSPSGDLTGIFEGHIEIKWEFGLGNGKFHLRGTGGDFVGLHMWGTFVESGPPPGDFTGDIEATIR